MLIREEIERYQQKHEKLRPVYGEVSDRILNECLQYRRQNPNTVRAVFSRQPKVKDFPKIIVKINAKRQEEDARYTYDDLPDIIALTVLCPYRSDVDEFARWMQKTFTINPDEPALRDTPAGHRAYHYVVSVRPEVERTFPEYRGIKCEIQIQTVLEQAIDAKTHDLTYKPVREVDPKLKDQFALLATSLKAIDQLSEFLKDLILEEEKELRFRREAAVTALFLDQATIAIGEELGIQIGTATPEDVHAICDLLERRAMEDITTHFCKLAALCALELDDDYIKGQTERYVDVLVETSADRASALRCAGSIKWALGGFEEAIKAASALIDLGDQTDTIELVTQGKSNFIYFVADWKSVRNEERTELTNRASDYAEELGNSAAAQHKDTVGFYWIIFGESTEQIDLGRKLIQESIGERQDDKICQAFFRYHEYVALRRLAKKLEQIQ